MSLKSYQNNLSDLELPSALGLDTTLLKQRPAGTEACLTREIAFIADSFSPQPHPNLNVDLVQAPLASFVVQKNNSLPGLYHLRASNKGAVVQGIFGHSASRDCFDPVTPVNGFEGVFFLIRWRPNWMLYYSTMMPTVGFMTGCANL